MAEHAELQILRAVKAAIEVGGGYVVYLNRTAPFGSRDQLPAIVLHYGDDNVELQTAQFIDSTLDVEIELVVSEIEAAANSATAWLSSARRDIHARLRADHMLGLGIVRDVLPVSATEPELDEQADFPTVRRRLTWQVKYRTRVDDATQL